MSHIWQAGRYRGNYPRWGWKIRYCVCLEIYVSVSIYIYFALALYMYMYMYATTYWRLFVCVPRTEMHLHFTYTDAHTFVWMHVCKRIYPYMCVCVVCMCVYTHAHMHIFYIRNVGTYTGYVGRTMSGKRQKLLTILRFFWPCHVCVPAMCVSACVSACCRCVFAHIHFRATIINATTPTYFSYFVYEHICIITPIYIYILYVYTCTYFPPRFPFIFTYSHTMFPRSLLSHLFICFYPSRIVFCLFLLCAGLHLSLSLFLSPLSPLSLSLSLSLTQTPSLNHQYIIPTTPPQLPPASHPHLFPGPTPPRTRHLLSLSRSLVLFLSPSRLSATFISLSCSLARARALSLSLFQFFSLSFNFSLSLSLSLLHVSTTSTILDMASWYPPAFSVFADSGAIFFSESESARNKNKTQQVRARARACEGTRLQET